MSVPPPLTRRLTSFTQAERHHYNAVVTTLTTALLAIRETEAGY